MLSLIRLGREAGALDARVDAQRAESRYRLLLLRQGLHRKMTAPSTIASSFAAGIVTGHLSGVRADAHDDDDSEQRRSASPARTAMGYGRWALRIYFTQKVADLLRSI